MQATWREPRASPVKVRRLDRVFYWSCTIRSMDQRSINDAVKQAVRHCLDSDIRPLDSLNRFLEGLGRDGFTLNDIEIVRAAATKMLTAIYDPGDDVPPE